MPSSTVAVGLGALGAVLASPASVEDEMEGSNRAGIGIGKRVVLDPHNAISLYHGKIGIVTGYVQTGGESHDRDRCVVELDGEELTIPIADVALHDEPTEPTQSVEQALRELCGCFASDGDGFHVDVVTGGEIRREAVSDDVAVTVRNAYRALAEPVPGEDA